MNCLLIYDIPDDGVRSKIADFCLNYGLDRVQYSAFIGELATTHQEELMLKIEKRLGKAAGRIDLFAICREDWRRRRTLEQGMDRPTIATAFQPIEDGIEHLELEPDDAETGDVSAE